MDKNGFSNTNSHTINGGLRLTKKINWQWVILMFSALNVIFLGGKRRAFGTFIAELHHGIFNNTSLAELNWIGDSYSALGYLTVGLSTWFILWINRRYRVSQLLGGLLILLACISSAYVNSVHWLFFTHTVIHGAGSSLILATVGLIIGEYFPKEHKYYVLATTLVSGGSLASVVFVELYAILIDEYGWRGALIILGIVYAFVTWSAAIVFCGKNQYNIDSNHPANNENHAASRNAVNTKVLLRSFRRIGNGRIMLIIFWLFDRILTSIVTYGMLLNLTDYLRRHSATLTKSTSLTALFAAGEAVTYLLGAVLGAVTKDRMKDKLRYILLFSTLLMSLSLFLWEYVARRDNFGRYEITLSNMDKNNTVTIATVTKQQLGSSSSFSQALAFMSGLFLGPSITFLFPAGAEMTQLPGEAAYPVTLGGMGLGMLISPVLSAMVAQRFKYKWFFVVQGSLMLLKFFCLLVGILLLWLFKYRKYFPTNNNPLPKSNWNRHLDDEECLLESDQLTMQMKRDDSSFLPLPQTQNMEDDEEYEDEDDGTNDMIDDEFNEASNHKENRLNLNTDSVYAGVEWDRIDLDDVEESNAARNLESEAARNMYKSQSYNDGLFRSHSNVQTRI